MSLFKVSIDRLKGRNVSTKTKNRKQKIEKKGTIKKAKVKRENKKKEKGMNKLYILNLFSVYTVY